MSYQLDLSRQDLLLTTLTGAWAREFEPDTAPVRRGRTVFGSVSGTSGHYCNPFFALSDPNTGEHSGEIYGFNLIYSGSYAASVEADSYGSLRIMAGVQSEGFHWTLAPGESFLTPEAVLTSSITGTLQFQSTSSVWRTTGGRHQGAHVGLISIPVLRVEDDAHCSVLRSECRNFNPRPPCGGRLTAERFAARVKEFQSTSSVWRTTYWAFVSGCSPPFQSTSFVWRTTCRLLIRILPRKFQSTSSVWRTTAVAVLVRRRHLIAIHVLRVEDDFPYIPSTMLESKFIPRPPCGGRRTTLPAHDIEADFNPRPPCGGRPAPGTPCQTGYNFNPRPPCGGRPPVTSMPT